MTYDLRMIVILPLDFRAKTSVTEDVEQIESPARNAGLWLVRGPRKPRDQEETTMTEQQIEATPPGSAMPRPGKKVGKTKSDDLRQLLSRRTGATIAQLQKKLGWQPHTIRAAISRLRSAGLSIDLDRSGKVARYRLVCGQDQ